MDTSAQPASFSARDSQDSAAQPAAPAPKESVRDQMERILRSNLEITHLEITDTSGNCGSSYALIIVSPSFQGKMGLARHKLVNAMLKDQIEQLHAFSQKPLTPQQWEKEKTK